MEAYPPSNISSSHLSQNPDEATKGLKNGYSFQSHSLLHSVRKSQAKPWKKAPVAPPTPTPIKVYQVDVLNFRNLVQQLTGAPEFKPQLHHQSVDVTSPSPIWPSRDIAAEVSSNWYPQSEALGMESQETSGRAKPQGLVELNLSSSSSSYNWY
ncbi:hypothetical protein SESBI_18810 [Sesbania bispinosa]|nr:hypothetical protein SESBI_18810 [Sesbania bispinosa]